MLPRPVLDALLCVAEQCNLLVWLVNSGTVRTCMRSGPPTLPLNRSLFILACFSGVLPSITLMGWPCFMTARHVFLKTGRGHTARYVLQILRRVRCRWCRACCPSPGGASRTTNILMPQNETRPPESLPARFETSLWLFVPAARRERNTTRHYGMQMFWERQHAQ